MRALQLLLNAEADYTATVHGRRPAKEPSCAAADACGARQTNSVDSGTACNGSDEGTACNGIASQAAAASTAAAGSAAVQLASIANAAAAATDPADCATNGASGAAAPATATGAAADSAPAAAAALLKEDSAKGSRTWSRVWSFGSNRPSMLRRPVYAALIRERGLHLKPWRLVVTGHR